MNLCQLNASMVTKEEHHVMLQKRPKLLHEIRCIPFRCCNSNIKAKPGLKQRCQSANLQLTTFSFVLNLIIYELTSERDMETKRWDVSCKGCQNCFRGAKLGAGCYPLTCRMLSMAWTPRSRFRPPHRMQSTQDTMPGRVTGSNICVGAGTDKGRCITDSVQPALTKELQK